MSAPSSEFNLEEYILHHVQNTNEWHIPFLPVIHLPDALKLHQVMLLLAAAIILLLFCIIYRKDQKVPTGATNLLEAFVLFIRDKVAIANMGEEDGKKFTPFLCTLFFFILTMNLISQIPIFPAATANISVTAALALIIFSFMTVGAIAKNGFVGFLKSFVMPNIDWYLQIIIIPLEVLGIFTRTFALMIRLFANMLAGHMVVLAFLGLVAVIGWYVTPLSIGLALFIKLLEILVCFLQAYIFTLLAAIFIGQAYHPHH